MFCGAETPLGARTLVSAVLDLSPEAIPGKPEPEEILARADADLDSRPRFATCHNARLFSYKSLVFNRLCGF